MDCSGHLWLSQRNGCPIPPTPSSSSSEEACGPHLRPWHPVLGCGVMDRLSPQWPAPEPHPCVHWAHKKSRLAALQGGSKHTVLTAGASCDKSQVSHAAGGEAGAGPLGEHAHSPRVPGGLWTTLVLQKLQPGTLRVLRTLPPPQRMESYMLTHWASLPLDQREPDCSSAAAPCDLEKRAENC